MSGVSDGWVHRRLMDGEFLLAERSPDGWGDSFSSRLRIMENGWACCFAIAGGTLFEVAWESRYKATDWAAIKEKVASLQGVPVPVAGAIDAAHVSMVFREGDGERLLYSIDGNVRRPGELGYSPDFVELWDMIHTPFRRFLREVILHARLRPSVLLGYYQGLEMAERTGGE